MPEGDTIFRAARTLHRALAGKPVVRFETVLAQLARVDDDAPIAGRTVERVRSVGKHLLVEFSGDLVLRTHMRMTGAGTSIAPASGGSDRAAAMRVVVETADFQAVAFDVPVAEFRTGARAGAGIRRSHGSVRTCSTRGSTRMRRVRRLRARGTLGIGDALLDQRALAGIGNVFKSEVCFVERVHPFTPVSALEDEVAARAGPDGAALPRDERARVERRRNGDVHRAPADDSPGRPVGPPLGLRTGREACRVCGERIVVERRGPDARSTYFCPGCQGLAGD